MSYKLAINTGFAVNRYPLAEEWIDLVANKLEVKYVQFTSDLLNPYLPEKIYFKEAENIQKLISKNDLIKNSTFTGAFTRLNHLGHPDENIQNYWINWFKKFIDFSVLVNAESMGSHLGIMSALENKDPNLRKNRLDKVIKNWHVIGDYAQKKGLKFLSWEPMSIGREFGQTINECEIIQKKLNTNTPIPFKICLDVDHGDSSSKNPRDTNPYEWIKYFSKDICYLHLKQSIKNKLGHWPFIKKYNEEGKINPNKIVNLMNSLSMNNIPLILELSFKEREPYDSLVEEQVRESFEYWKRFI